MLLHGAQLPRQRKLARVLGAMKQVLGATSRTLRSKLKSSGVEWP